MRAWQVTGHGEPRDVLARTEVEPPTPGPDELRVRVLAAAVSLPDVMMCRGTYAYSPELPFTPGQEVTGDVTAAGTGARFAPGDRIMGVTRFDAGRGGFADETLVRASGAYRVPAGLSDSDAAGFYIAYATAWYGLVTRGGLAPGEWLAVLGAAGGTGAAAVQLGHALGARVIAVVGDADGDDRKARYCSSLGADHVLDHRRASVPDTLRDLTGGGVDAIYDPVGGAPAIDALGGLATGGRLLSIGFASGPGEQPSARHVLRRNASIVGVFVGAYDRAANEDTVARLGELAAAGRIGGLATMTVGFDDLPDALDRVARRAVTGRIVVVP